MTDTVSGRYFGEGTPLFWLYVRTALLTLLTLGIYRFWAKTRIRRYIWSSTEAAEDSFEYTGTGLEKFLGFLVAVVILAIYLGVVQLLLAYFGIFLFEDPQTDMQMLLQVVGIYLSLLAVLPLVYFARYRARRYRMARTRWRGLRFGMERGAWGYAIRALGHLLLTVLTLGVLLPRMTFYLEKYMTDRTWYGDARFVQEGRWSELYPGLKHVGIGLVIVVAGALVASVAARPGLGALIGALGSVWLMIGLVFYRVYVFNYLTSQKWLGEDIAFQADLLPRKVLGIFVTASLAATGVLLLGSAVIGGLLTATLGVSLGSSGLDPQSLEAPAAGALMITSLATGLLYLALIIVLGGVWLVMVNQRVIAAAVSALVIENPTALSTVRQREADRGADAEGFADALDVGGAI